MRSLLCTIAIVALTAPGLHAASGVRPGEFIIEPPTLICLGFEWAISGDDNRNATVEVTTAAPLTASGATHAAAAHGGR